MSIAYDTTTGIGSGTGIQSTQSWSHTAAASNVGGVGVIVSGESTEETSYVTYGGTYMRRVATGANTGGETGTTSCWWLGAGDAGWPGSGTQTVQVVRSGSSDYIAQAVSVTVASGLAAKVVGGINVGYDEGSSLSTSSITTSLTIPSGFEAFLFGGLYSGENALSSITDDASLTRINSGDFGTSTAVIDRRTAIFTSTGSALTSFAWTQSSDDAAWAVVAVHEYTPVSSDFPADAIRLATFTFPVEDYSESSLSQKSPPFTASSELRSIGFDGTYYVAGDIAGELGYATDPTGTWTLVGTNPLTGTIADVLYANGIWVAVASNGIATATDPTGTWTQRSTATSIVSVAYGDGYWVALNTSGLLYTATDPTGTWTYRTDLSASTAYQVAYGNGYFVVTGNIGRLDYATDPTGTWTQNTAFATAWGSTSIQSATYEQGLWVFGGGNGQVGYGTDPTGSSWTVTAPLASTFYVMGIASKSANQWLLVALNSTPTGRIYTANHPGGTWTQRYTNAVQANGVFYSPGDDLFVTVWDGVRVKTATWLYGPGIYLDAFFDASAYQYGSFLAKATILGTESDSFHVDALIGQAVYADFVVDAIVLGESSDFLLADAVLLGPESGSFHVDARTEQPLVSGDFSVDAILFGTVIGGVTFRDEFNRTVSPGFGDSYTREEYWGTGGDEYVDGSTGVVPAQSGVIIVNPDVPSLDAFELSWDFWAQETQSSGWISYIGIALNHLYVDFYIPDQPTTSPYDATVNGYRATAYGYSQQIPPAIPLSIEAGNWYSIRVGKASSEWMVVEVWKRGEPETVQSESYYLPSEVYPAYDHPFWLTIEGASAETMRLDNLLVTSIGVNARALILGSVSGSFPIDAYFERFNFPVAAWVFGPRMYVDASISIRRRSLYLVRARIGPPTGILHLDAYIAPWFHIDGLIIGEQAGSFGIDAWVETALGKTRSMSVQAILAAAPTSSFLVRAYKRIPTRAGNWAVAALILGGVESSSTIDAVIDSGEREGSFAAAADISAIGEERGAIGVAAALARTSTRPFVVRAQISQAIFPLNAWIANNFSLNAWLSATFSVNAWLAGPFPVGAWIEGQPSSSLAVDAVVADENGAWPGHLGFIAADAVLSAERLPVGFWLDARIANPPASFPVQSRIAVSASSFPAAALIETTDGAIGQIPVAAFVRSNATIIWPEDGGPATDPNGVPLPSWWKASRKFRIDITVDGTSITGDVIWSRTEFTQNAKTNPGTFTITLDGAFPSFHGGEEVLVTVDDFRIFGGYVLAVERGYALATAVPQTVLTGADFNVLFDHLIVYNKTSATGTSGSYANWKSFAKNTQDTVIIEKVFSSYVDLPPGFDYWTYIDPVGIANPEKPWSMPTAGSSLRLVMQSLSQVTTAVWWIDPYKHLHYHSRATVTAPFPITDGYGGIAGQALSSSSDINMMVNDGLVWGTLSYNVDGKISAVRRDDDESISAHGRWQYGEFRSDLHHQEYIERRAESILERYADPVNKGQVVIYEPGYQAGMVTRIILTEHGVTEDLVIRSLKFVIAVGKEPDGDTYYGVPRYELSLGLDPETPWDIYDYLPFPDHRPEGWVPWQRCQSCQDDCYDEAICECNWPETDGIKTSPVFENTRALLYNTWAWDGDGSSFMVEYNETADYIGLRVETDPQVGNDDYFLSPVSANLSIDRDPKDWYNANQDRFPVGLGSYNVGWSAIVSAASGTGNFLTGVVTYRWVHYTSNNVADYGTFYEGYQLLIQLQRQHYDASEGGWHTHYAYWQTPAYVPYSPSNYQAAPILVAGIQMPMTLTWDADSASISTPYATVWLTESGLGLDGWEPDELNYRSDYGTNLSIIPYPYPGDPLVELGPEHAVIKPTYILNYDLTTCCFDEVGSECDDPDGEQFGAVTEGWGCETVYVRDGLFVTTGIVSKGTLSVYDADTGIFMHPGTDWADYDQDGKDFTVLNGASRVIACYRNFVVNVGAKPTTPREITPYNRYRAVPV